MREFLARFGGLEIADLVRPKGRGVGHHRRSGNEPFLIDPVTLFEEKSDLTEGDEPLMPRFSEVVRAELFPVGGRDGGKEYWLLLMAEDGRIFVATDEQGYMWHVADLGLEAIEVICNGDSLQRPVEEEFDDA